MPTHKWMRMQIRLLKDFGPFVVAKEAFFFACGPWHFTSCTAVPHMWLQHLLKCHMEDTQRSNSYKLFAKVHNPKLVLEFPAYFCKKQCFVVLVVLPKSQKVYYQKIRVLLKKAQKLSSLSRLKLSGALKNFIPSDLK